MADATTTFLAAMTDLVRPRARTERGAILVEYALLIALIVVVCLGAVSAFGAKVPAHGFSSVSNVL